MVISLKSDNPEDQARQIGAAAKRLRLDRNLTRQALAERAGVPISTLRRFESTGLAPFLTVLRIAAALGRDGRADALFAPDDSLPGSLDELLQEDGRAPRQRARGTR